MNQFPNKNTIPLADAAELPANDSLELQRILSASQKNAPPGDL